MTVPREGQPVSAEVDSTPDASQPVADGSPPPARPQRTGLRRAALLLMVVAAGVGGWVYYVNQGLNKAKVLAVESKWPQVRSSLNTYLVLHPNDSEARLLMAESYVKDPELDAETATEKALEHLARVPNEGTLGQRARLQEARVFFLVRHQPARAEEALERAREIDSEDYEAAYLSWQIFTLSGRTHLGEPHFWVVYASTPLASRGELLRDWYMSQFFPSSAGLPVARQMGLVQETDVAASLTMQRLVQFRRSEGDRSWVYGAQARFFQQDGDLETAQGVLQLGLELEDPFADPFFVSVLVDVMLDLGEFEKAIEYFGRWPEPRDGYDYWRIDGMVQEEAHQDYEAAVASYDRAVSIWPGEIDWRTQFRKARCLRRLKKIEEAEVTRKVAEVRQKLTDDELHAQIRVTLNDLGATEKLGEVVQFYREMGREKEATAWEEYVAYRVQNPEEEVTRPSALPGALR